LMLLLYFFVFGVVATQLWHGVMMQRCHRTTAVAERCLRGEQELCNAHSGLLAGDDAAFCDPASSGKGLPWEGKACSAGDVCEVHHTNPYWGTLSFDSIVAASIPVLQMVTLSSWQDVMHITQDATGSFAVIYFLAGAVVGGYFLLNLVIAVLKSKFEIASALGNEGVDVFDEVDLDGSGELDVDELRQVFGQLPL
jgi:hypothetical protein